MNRRQPGNSCVWGVALLTAVLVLVACASLDPGTERQSEPATTRPAGVLATVAPLVGPTVRATLQNLPPAAPSGTIALATAAGGSPTGEPSPATPSAMIPVPGGEAARLFHNLRFATGPDEAPQRQFPGGTEEVFALWEYGGLVGGDVVRRIWLRNDEIWLVREEAWDGAAYGARGTVRDISVYDEEGSGLPPATYRLQLYVNDVFQAEASFIVLP